MTVLRITRRFTFEMAHALWNYDGLCRNIHGHSYKLFVTLKGSVREDPDDPAFGMVCDFKELKSIVHQAVLMPFDHALVVYKQSLPEPSVMAGLDMKTHELNFQPTCENLVAYFAEEIKPLLPDGIQLWHLKLYETEKACAEWWREDQED